MGGYTFFFYYKKSYSFMHNPTFMNKNFLLSLVTLLLCCASAKAVPAYPVRRTFVQPDGTTLTLTLRGDEHFSYYTTDDGQPWVRNLDGSFRTISLEETEEIWTKRMKAQNTRRKNARRRALGEQKDPIVGKKKGLVILAAFSNQDFSVTNPQQIYKDFFSKPGYNDYGMTGSVRDYFLDQSYGQLDIEFDVVGPVKLNKTMAYYGAPTESSNDVRPAQMIYDACVAISDKVNFSDYDWDGNGKVDQVFVIYAGYGQNYGADPNTIWPHEFSLSAMGLILQRNNVLIDTYACSCELSGTRGSNLDGIGAACHEFTHCLGIPDFYDTSAQGSNYGMGSWDVMCSGSYNNAARTPAGYTAYERAYAGWFKPTELTELTRVKDMKPLAQSPEAYAIYNEGFRDEYYLLENRQPVKWDAALPGHGLLVVHVCFNEEAWMSNDVNTNPNQQMMTIIPADGITTNYSESADPFPGTKNVTELSRYTQPAASLYEPNKDGQKFMSKSLDNISESPDGLISFVACRPELGIPQPDKGTEVTGQPAFTITWPAVPGAIGYEIELTEIGSASTDPAEALEKEYNFQKLVTKSTGFTDVSNKLDQYGFPGWTGSKLFTSPNQLLMGTSSAAGTLHTPTWYVPQSSDLTVAIGAKPFKDGTPVTGKVRVAFGNSGEAATYDELPFTLNEEGLMTFPFTIRKDLYWVEFLPSSRVYVNYFAIYDGVWTAEQLQGNAAKGQPAPRRKASTVTNYTTDTNSYTLADLNARNRFVYRVRALGEENTYSQWSAENMFTFSAAAGIDAIVVDRASSQRGIYDLNGRYVGSSLDGLAKGIYIVDGKKVVR